MKLFHLWQGLFIFLMIIFFSSNAFISTCQEKPDGIPGEPEREQRIEGAYGIPATT